MANLDETGEFKHFIKWCQAKHSHLVSLWQKLDKDGSMSLHKIEFIRGLKELHYDGDLEKLWAHLDSDHTGTISFTEFAPENALDLARFKQWAQQKFGSLQAAFRALDVDRSGRITLQEFVEACKQQGFPPHLAKCSDSLFLLLDSAEDTTGRGTITEDELLFLDVWNCPAYLWEEPDFVAKDVFKNALLKRYNGNAFLAWRKALDKDSSMRVNFEEFTSTCKTLTRAGLEEAGPASGVTALFVALDADRSGWFSIRNWDEESHKALVMFTKWAKGKTGKVTDCIRSMAQGKLVTWLVFKQALRGSGLNNTQLPLLFEGFCKSGNAFSAGDVSFLDRWDPDRELKEEMAWEKMATERLFT